MFFRILPFRSLINKLLFSKTTGVVSAAVVATDIVEDMTQPDSVISGESKELMLESLHSLGLTNLTLEDLDDPSLEVRPGEYIRFDSDTAIACPHCSVTIKGDDVLLSYKLKKLNNSKGTE